MAAMNTDVAVLAAEASNFDTISGELKGVITHVTETVGGQLAVDMVGDAGGAATAALDRFRQAGDAQIKELTDISNNIHTAGVQYASADEDHAGSVANAMNI